VEAEHKKGRRYIANFSNRKTVALLVVEFLQLLSFAFTLGVPWDETVGNALAVVMPAVNFEFGKVLFDVTFWASVWLCFVFGWLMLVDKFKAPKTGELVALGGFLGIHHKQMDAKVLPPLLL